MFDTRKNDKISIIKRELDLIFFLSIFVNFKKAFLNLPHS